MGFFGEYLGSPRVNNDCFFACIIYSVLTIIFTFVTINMWRSVFLLLLVSFFLLPFNLIKSFRESISSFFFVYIISLEPSLLELTFTSHCVLLFSLTQSYCFLKLVFSFYWIYSPHFAGETTSLTFKEKILGEKKNESLHILKGFLFYLHPCLTFWLNI